MSKKKRARAVRLPELDMPTSPEPYGVMPAGRDTAPTAFVTEQRPPLTPSEGVVAIKASDGGLVFVLPPLWAERLTKLATHASVSPNHYLEMLVRKQWASGAAVVSRGKP